MGVKLLLCSQRRGSPHSKSNREQQQPGSRKHERTQPKSQRDPTRPESVKLRCCSPAKQSGCQQHSDKDITSRRASGFAGSQPKPLTLCVFSARLLKQARLIKISHKRVRRSIRILERLHCHPRLKRRFGFATKSIRVEARECCVRIGASVDMLGE